MQQAKRHPRTGEPIVPIMFRKPRAHRGEIGLQPVWPIMGGAPDPDPDPDPNPDPGRTFTQAELSAKAAEEKKQGRRAGAREAIEALGFSSADEAKAFVDAQRSAAEDKKTEDQRRADELAERERKAEQRDRDAAARERRADLRAALVELGSTGDDLDDAYALLDPRVETDADADDIATAATALKERRPELFSGAPAGPPRRPGNLPGGRPGKPKPPAPKRGAGGLAAAQRRGHIKNTQD